MGQSNVHTHTHCHPDKQRPRSAAKLTFGVIKTPMMHSFLPSLLILLVPLSLVSSSSSSFQSLFHLSHYRCVSTSNSHPDFIYVGNIGWRRQGEAMWRLLFDAPNIASPSLSRHSSSSPYSLIPFLSPLRPFPPPSLTPCSSLISSFASALHFLPPNIISNPSFSLRFPSPTSSPPAPSNLPLTSFQSSILKPSHPLPLLSFREDVARAVQRSQV